MFGPDPTALHPPPVKRAESRSRRGEKKKLSRKSDGSYPDSEAEVGRPRVLAPIKRPHNQPVLNREVPSAATSNGLSSLLTTTCGVRQETKQREPETDNKS